MTIAQELSLIFPMNRIIFKGENLSYYAKDWTTYFDIQAAAIVFPTSIDEVVQLVKWARGKKIGLVPSGGRTGLSGGACATCGEVVVSFEKMNQILEFDPIDATVRVQAGIITEELQKFANDKGLFYPVDFAARGSSQIGGNIATNAGGIKVVRYGMTRDWVVGLTVVTGTGDVLQLNQSLVKNATGFDFRHLFIGSEGTLGFVVEATLRLAPPPPSAQVLFLAVNSLEALMQIFAEFRRFTKICAFEMLSEKALSRVTEKTGLPRPLTTSAPFYVVVEVEQPNQQSEAALHQAFEGCLDKGWLVDGALATSAEQARHFWRLREDISESLATFSPYKNDISVRISKVPAFLTELEALLAKAYPNWEVVWFGHIGDGNLHLNILRPSGLSKEDFVQECRKVDLLIFNEIQKWHGSISAEHGVGLTKKSFLSFSRSAAEIELMKKVKSSFDPDGIMNPGKMLSI